MEDSKLKPEEMAFFMQSNASCDNPQLGDLMGAYLCDALPTDKRAAFEAHLEGCIACWTDVANWENLGMAAKEQRRGQTGEVNQAKSFKAGR